jgi:hypothetical protein
MFVRSESRVCPSLAVSSYSGEILRTSSSQLAVSKKGKPFHFSLLFLRCSNNVGLCERGKALKASFLIVSILLLVAAYLCAARRLSLASTDQFPYLNFQVGRKISELMG